MSKNTSSGNLRKEIKADIEEAVAQIIDFILKHSSSKEDLIKVENRLDGVENKLGGVENRLSNVEFEVKDIKRSINDLKADIPTPEEYKNHDKRITHLETAVFPQ